MHRQIWIDDRDVDYQRILWRSHSSDPVSEYQLLTVTYGTNSAPYSALRVLQQLNHDAGEPFPLAQPLSRKQTYVDDCIFDADDQALTRQTRDQFIDLVAKGGFELRKWASNCPDLLTDIDPNDHGLAYSRQLQEDECLKVLGIIWNPSQDAFQFHVSTDNCRCQSKREILSTVDELFDPLGWATPVIITAKIFLQQLWLLKRDWDEELPLELRDEWTNYHFQLSRLNHHPIPR